jgi:transposase
MPRHRSPQSPKVVYRTARAGLRVTRGQRRRLLRLLVSAGDVWSCVLELNAWRHNQRTRDWRIGHLIAVLKDKAEAAGIGMTLVDERGTSSTCPACASRGPKPKGRLLACPACGHTGHRDLLAAANIAAGLGGGTTPVIPVGVTHRRAGAHLPGVASSRRDPRRRAHHRGARGSPGRHRPAPASPPELARESLATRRGACNSLM